MKEIGCVYTTKNEVVFFKRDRKGKKKIGKRERVKEKEREKERVNKNVKSNETEKEKCVKKNQNL